MEVDGHRTWLGGVTVDEVREVWGNRLAQVPPDMVSPRLSVATRSFLTSAGLPSVRARDIIFIHDERLLDSVEQAGREYVVIAESDEPGYCFAVEVSTDRIFYLDEIPEYSRLINSDIALFTLFVGIFQKDVVNFPGTGSEALGNATATLWDRLRARDPEAAQNGNCWGAILDDVTAE